MMVSRCGTSKTYKLRQCFVRRLTVDLHRKVNPVLSKGAETLLPWHLGYKDTEYWTDAIQCLIAGSNFYYGNQGAVNHGKNDLWAKTQTAWSWGYYKRQDLPVQYALAEGWTTGDMYQVSGKGSRSCRRALTAHRSRTLPPLAPTVFPS